MVLPTPSQRPTAENVQQVLSDLVHEMDQRKSLLPVHGTAIIDYHDACVLCLKISNLFSISDQEWMRHLLTWWYGTAKNVIEEQGGISDRHVSDRVYGFFGVKELRGDEGERAIRAARQVSRALRRIARVSGEPIELTAGVAWGPAYVGQSEQACPKLTVTGELVERAEILARSKIKEGNLRADGAIHERTKNLFRFQEFVLEDQRFGRIYFFQERSPKAS
jgi:hypothetical protein